jgi:hypothetical protein
MQGKEKHELTNYLGTVHAIGIKTSTINGPTRRGANQTNPEYGNRHEFSARTRD